ncbi:Uncharacterized protein FWK35_00026266 [Aphis craccivora]|uniref:DDE-1 domain-containing protein n=1 Tax=Aphis craccivora TaxID=307492 RepID=A0A6G0VYN7_APHCR|nr:Uncharacterized protein FWK35_00026266 [Aphis craccivora]
MLSLPPHTSHRLQLLDVNFFGPLKAAFKRECDLYIKSHCLLFNKAYSCVAKIQKGISGFTSTGIVPMNPNIFTDEDYFAAVTLNCDDPINVIETPNTSKSTPQSSKNAVDSLVSPQISQGLVSIEELTPIPKKLPIKMVRRVTAKQHPTLITGTPMKDKLQEREKKKREFGSTKKDKISKRNLFDEFMDSDDESVDIMEICDDDSDDNINDGSEFDIGALVVEFGYTLIAVMQIHQKAIFVIYDID